METILSSLFLFLDLIKIILYIDIILSFATLIGVVIRPKFIADIIDPLYKVIQSKITTSFGPFDFTPIIILFGITLLQSLLYSMNPNMISIFQIFS